VSGQQEPLLLLDVSTLQWPELHLDVSGQQEPLLLLDVSTLQGPELHLEVSVQKEPILDWFCLHHTGLSCTLTCV
jgi:hypothetical protein